MTRPRLEEDLVAHSSSCLGAIAEGGVDWNEDADFGYLLPAAVPGIAADDVDLLNPKARFKALGRMDEYDGWVTKLKAERRAFLEGFPDLDPYILEGV
jgi:phosphoenolpyruvate carboxykinase (ATP)